METKTQKRETIKNKTRKCKKRGLKGRQFNIKKYSKTNKNVSLKKVNCSPKPKGEINDFSCYTNTSLYKLRDLWNDRHPDVKITSNSPKEIHRFIS